MPTPTQLSRKLVRKIHHRKRKRRLLDNCPQKGGTITPHGAFNVSPKKPCSGKRFCAYVLFKQSRQKKKRYRFGLCRVQGESRIKVARKKYVETHLRESMMGFAKVTVGGGRSLTIPGTKYRIIYRSLLRSGHYAPKPLLHRNFRRSRFANVNSLKRKKARTNRLMRLRTILFQMNALRVRRDPNTRIKKKKWQF